MLSKNDKIRLTLQQPYIEKYKINPKVCSVCGKVLPYEKRRCKTCSDECAKESRTSKNIDNGLYKRLGGFREGAGRSKSGYYKGSFCGSTYELAYWIYCKDHGIDIERNTKVYPYTINGKTKTYLPDYIVEGHLVEVKGYVNSLTLIKASAVKEGVKIITLKELEPMMDYIDKKYGVHHKGKSNNYASLYDGWRPTYEYKCSFCGNTFYRERLIKTNDKFCSRSCAGKYQQNKNKGGCPSG